jgi:hypothetical protein
MRTFSIAGFLAAATTLGGIHANATPLPPTLEFSDGPVASVPVTTGNISFGGVTVNGAPVIGSATQQVLQVNGTVTTNLFNPLPISATEFNLSNPTGESLVAASISGTLAPMSSLSWSVYLDPTNNPFGTSQLIASGNFSDPSSVLGLGFVDPAPAVFEAVPGPFSLTELLSISAPTGSALSFTSSVTATSVPASEPASLAVLGSGMLGLGLIAQARRRRSRALSC